MARPLFSPRRPTIAETLDSFAVPEPLPKHPIDVLQRHPHPEVTTAKVGAAVDGESQGS